MASLAVMTCSCRALYTGTVTPAPHPRQLGLAADSLTEMLSLPDSEIDIGRAALLLVREDEPGLDVDYYLRRLDALAARVARLVPPGTAVADAVRRTVVVTQPSAGAIGELDQSAQVPLGPGLPDRINLARILDGAKGNCLGISLLYLAVAERAGLPFYGVSVPEHFFVRYDDGVRTMNVETTRGGRIVPDRAFLQGGRIARAALNTGIYMRSESKREVLGSLLANRAGYRALAGRTEDALEDIELALELKPLWPQSHVNRGLALELQVELDRAEASYREALALDPHNTGALNNLAAMYAREHEGDPEKLREAARMMRLAVLLRPESAFLRRTAAAVQAAAAGSRSAPEPR